MCDWQGINVLDFFFFLSCIREKKSCEKKNFAVPNLPANQLRFKYEI